MRQIIAPLKTTIVNIFQVVVQSVKYIAVKFYQMVADCTTCDNTQPPSNCGPREPYGGKEEPKNFDPNNGAVFHDEGSNDSKNTNPKNIGDNVFNDGSSSEEKGSNINPDKIIEEGGFNQ